MRSIVTSARQLAIKITQVENIRLSKADRVKKLHYENKYLFGSSIKVKKKKFQEPVEHVEESKNSKDMSSEIYWTCLHVPEVQDFTKKSKCGRKKKSQDIAPELPNDALTDLLNKNNDVIAAEREIPFENEQLRAIPNFPLVWSESKTIGLDKLVPLESSIRLPSVSKILQATMPETARLALVRWKNQKIEELGLEGFEIFQQCKKLNFTT